MLAKSLLANCTRAATRSSRIALPARSLSSSLSSSSLSLFSSPSSSAPIRSLNTTPFVTSTAPSFTANAIVDGEIKKISLSENYKGKWVVLFFYPLDFTFVCPTEIIAFSERIADFHKIDAEVLGISVDSEYCHLAWTNTPRSQGGIGKINFPLVADVTREIASSYNVLTPEGVALRGLFIIDPSGTVKSSIINDLPVGRSVEETLRLIQAFQFVEKHGEVCPANWKPGSESMKADPHGSKSYFKKQKDN